MALLRLADAVVGRVVEGPTHIAHVQPAIMEEEYDLVERVVRAHAGFQAACARRGIDPELVCMDPWCAGYFGPEDGPARRLSK